MGMVLSSLVFCCFMAASTSKTKRQVNRHRDMDSGRTDTVFYWVGCKESSANCNDDFCVVNFGSFEWLERLQVNTVHSIKSCVNLLPSKNGSKFNSFINVKIKSQKVQSEKNTKIF